VDGYTCHTHLGWSRGGEQPAKLTRRTPRPRSELPQALQGLEVTDSFTVEPQSPSSRKKVCLFCNDQQAKVTLEHVLSAPIWKHVDKGLIQRTTMDSFRNGERIVHNGWESASKDDKGPWTRKLYCEACNGGWMNDLDLAVSDLIGPLIHGDNASLSLDDQYLLATWITKVSLVFESMFADREVPDSTYRAFYHLREPSQTEPIDLAKFGGPFHHVFARRILKFRNYSDGHVTSVEKSVIVVSLDRFVFRCSLNVGSLIALNRVNSGYIVRMWPSPGAVIEWPPRIEIARESFSAFTEPAWNYL